MRTDAANGAFAAPDNIFYFGFSQLVNIMYFYLKASGKKMLYKIKIRIFNVDG